MAEEYFPFDAGSGADSGEDRWARMARLWAPPHVVGQPTSGAYDLTVSGLNVTVKRRADNTAAEAWVQGFMHRLHTADWTAAVPVNAATNPRVDRIALRLDPAANTVVIARLQGTPAASPVAPALTQVDGGTWEFPLWRFTVPANSVAPLTGLVDDRKWVDPDIGASALLAYKVGATNRASTTTPAADPELAFATVPVGSYLVEGAIRATGNSTGQIKIGLTGTAVFSGGIAWGASASAPNAIVDSSNPTAIRDNIPLQSNGTPTNGTMITPLGYLLVTTAGSLAVQWAQQNSEALLTSLQAGSWLRLTKIA